VAPVPPPQSDPSQNGAVQVQVVPWSYDVQRMVSNGQVWVMLQLQVPAIGLQLRLMAAQDEAKRFAAAVSENAGGITPAGPGAVPPHPG
jgi:hypothetical protein